MPIEHHADPAAFLAAAQGVLSRDACEAMMFESRMRTLAESASGAPVRRYLASYRTPRVRGIALQFRDSPAFLGPSDPRAGAPFADELVRHWSALPGVIGSPRVCEAFARRWRTHTGRKGVLRFHLANHLLTRVVPQPAPRGRPRLATAADRSWLVESQLAFVAETRIPDPPAEQPARVDRGLARNGYWIWDDRGPVAFAGWYAGSPVTARVGPVYTPPARRNRGYATALVAALSQALLDDGRTLLSLSTDLANPVSNAIYARIGYRPCGESFHLDLVDG